MKYSISLKKIIYKHVLIELILLNFRVFEFDLRLFISNFIDSRLHNISYKLVHSSFYYKNKGVCIILKIKYTHNKLYNSFNHIELHVFIFTISIKCENYILKLIKIYSSSLTNSGANY